jgi:hypothetical protein
MAGRSDSRCSVRSTEEKVRNPMKLQVLAAVALMSAGLLLSGCKSTPELTKANAVTLIQADYDQRPPGGASILVDDNGLQQGLTAKYWKLTKVYPNNKWADYTLTDEGKKALTLEAGGDVIQWRPDQGSSPHFMVVTVAQNHFKAHDVLDPQDEVVPGVATAKSATFTESLNFDGVPQPLQDIAHNPGNKPSSKRHANFELDNGAWKLHSIE